jgi:hypothetical protein
MLLLYFRLWHEKVEGDKQASHLLGPGIWLLLPFISGFRSELLKHFTALLVYKGPTDGCVVLQTEKSGTLKPCSKLQKITQLVRDNLNLNPALSHFGPLQNYSPVH